MEAINQIRHGERKREASCDEDAICALPCLLLHSRGWRQAPSEPPVHLM